MGHFAKFERLSIREHHVYYLSKKKSFAMMEDLLKSNLKKKSNSTPIQEDGNIFLCLNLIETLEKKNEPIKELMISNYGE